MQIAPLVAQDTEVRVRAFLPFAVDGRLDRLLVTGGTGFIGGATLAELIAGPFWPDTLILVRAATIEEGRLRIERSIKRFYPGLPLPRDIHADQIVLAGLEDSHLIERDPRIERVTHVIHSAAVTSFSAAPKIRAINVDASLEFARAVHNVAEISRFVNVGTAWCAGLGATGRLVPEVAEPSAGEHAVPYTESKIDFERQVRAQLPGLPFVTARPSIVIGHTQHGTLPSGSIYWVFRSGNMLQRFTCALTDRIDVVPVDWVAKALIRLALKRGLKRDVYHLSSGSGGASTFGEIRDALALGHPGERIAYQQVEGATLARQVLARKDLFHDVNRKLLARALCLYGRFAESGTMFDNRHTLDEGVPEPLPFAMYAGRCAATAEATSIAAQMEDDFK